ncbi:MAG TPA: terminase large subunit [Ktedonobacterales bacterium]
MAERIRVALQLHERQYDFVFSPERFSFYVGGRGSGKTFAAAVRAIFATEEQPGSLGLVGAPTHPMLRDAAQRMFFDLCPPALIRRHIKTEQRTVMRNGSEILWRSLDQEQRTRGLNLAWFWLDEAPFCGYEAWRLLKAALRQPGYATAAWATGTPHGRDGYARDFELLPRAGHALYRASTRDNAHNLPPGFIEDLGYTGAFAEQEIEGQFVAFDGLVYAFDATVGGNLAEPPGGEEGRSFNRVIGGIDWGYTNPAVALVVGLDSDRRAWVTDEFYQRRASLEEVIIPAVVELTRAHNVSVWYADSEDPEAIDRLNAALGRAGIQCRARAVVKGAGSVRAGIQTVTTALAVRGDGTRGLYVSPRCPHTIAEFGAYAYAAAPEGSDIPTKRDVAEEPIKLNDHCLDALRYALHSELTGIAKTEAYLAALVAQSSQLSQLSQSPQPSQGQQEVTFR